MARSVTPQRSHASGADWNSGNCFVDLRLVIESKRGNTLDPAFPCFDHCRSISGTRRELTTSGGSDWNIMVVSDN